ncbi:MAG: hypothetical protein K5657_09255 [Desulfovibrio sp.]|nr:hypothetical protein [Desulfovibrio sp.]
MEEKIQWYKEVLTLEPNSKLFFPLAVLLSKNGQIEEALDTLRSGLSRHDEYLEARIFFIELLYSTQQKNFSSPEIQAELKKLEDMFSHYTGFWRAWADFIQHSGRTGDAPSVMRFLSLYFSDKTLSLQNVIEKGLQAIMQGGAPDTALPREEKSLTGAEGEPAETCAAPVPDGVCPTPVETAHEESPDILSEESLSEVAGTGTTVEAVPAAPVETEQQEPSPEENLQENLEVSPAGPDETGSMLFSGESDEVRGHCDDGELSLPSASLTNPAMQTAPSAESPSVDNVTGETGSGAADEDEEGLPEEQISLRTRSMAEILAEQGDIKGALDIYYELEAAATSVEESADLRQRITTLRKLLTPQEHTPKPQGDSGEKKKIVTIIEALSERLEARAQH